ncbi:MAG: O-antigen ligase family protein [Phycisphaerae bacterium]|jgi:hypothetical protein
MQRLIETGSFFLLIALVILRPLVAESYDSATSDFTAALGTVSDPSPVRTYVFDLLVLLAAGGWLFVRPLGRARPYRPSGLGYGLAIVALAAVISCALAGQRRLAINGAIDWLCLPLLTIILVQLMVEPWQRRLLVAAILASAAVQASTCVEQQVSGFDDTWNHYLSIKQDFWADQGVELDSNQVDAFERRMKSRESTGLFPHSNVAGSYLVLCLMTAAGLVIARLRRSKTPADWIALVAGAGGVVLIGLAAGLTKSIGAMAAAAIAVALWILVTWQRKRVDAHRTKMFALGWCCVVAGTLAVVAYGLYKDRPGRWTLTYEWQSSIMFRWQYWRASAGMIADHPLAGVGRENFGRHYLQYKSIQSPEEIANPHNLFVQAAADWGILGLIGVAAMLVGGSYVVCRCRDRGTIPPRRKASGEGRFSIMRWAIALTLVVVVGRLPLLGTDDFNYLYYTSVTTGIIWLLAFVAFAHLAAHLPASEHGTAGALSTGVAVGLFAFLAHEMINFAAFVPATATTFFALLAVRVADTPQRPPADERPASITWRLPLGALTAAIVVFAYVGFIPVGRAARKLNAAREVSMHLPPEPSVRSDAARLYADAARADRIDPTPYAERTARLVGSVTQSIEDRTVISEALRSLEQAIKRDPYSLKLRRMQMRLYQKRAEHSHDPDDLTRALQAAEEALKLYPLDPKSLVALADCQVEVARAQPTDELLTQALAKYERALEIDAKRLAWEELRRLRPSDRDAINARIEQVQTLLTDRL